MGIYFRRAFFFLFTSIQHCEGGILMLEIFLSLRNFQEHHLQRAIIAGLIIPTPEVSDVKDDVLYDKNYPADYKMPRQLIHVQRK